MKILWWRRKRQFLSVVIYILAKGRVNPQQYSFLPPTRLQPSAAQCVVCDTMIFQSTYLQWRRELCPGNFTLLQGKNKFYITYNKHGICSSSKECKKKNETRKFWEDMAALFSCFLPMRKIYSCCRFFYQFCISLTASHITRQQQDLMCRILLTTVDSYDAALSENANGKCIVIPVWVDLGNPKKMCIMWCMAM